MTRPAGVLFRTDIDPPAPVPPTPVVRCAAQARSVDLATVAGTGVAGRIRLSDLEPRASTGSGQRPRSSAVGDRAVVLAEADVSRLHDRFGAGLDLRAHVACAAAQVDVAGLGTTGLAVAVADRTGRLVAVPVSGAGDLSVAGMSRAMDRIAAATATGADRALADRALGGQASGDAAATLVIAGAMPEALVELPVVSPAPRVLVGVGSGRPSVVPVDDAGGWGFAVRRVASVVVTADAAVPHASLTALVSAVLRALEGDSGVVPAV